MPALLDRVLCRTEPSEPSAADTYIKHVRKCDQCNFGAVMCDRGLELYRRWMRAQEGQGPSAA